MTNGGAFVFGPVFLLSSLCSGSRPFPFAIILWNSVSFGLYRSKLRSLSPGADSRYFRRQLVLPGDRSAAAIILLVLTVSPRLH